MEDQVGDFLKQLAAKLELTSINKTTPYLRRRPSLDNAANARTIFLTFSVTR